MLSAPAVSAPLVASAIKAHTTPTLDDPEAGTGVLSVAVEEAVVVLVPVRVEVGDGDGDSDAVELPVHVVVAEEVPVTVKVPLPEVAAKEALTAAVCVKDMVTVPVSVVVWVENKDGVAVTE